MQYSIILLAVVYGETRVFSAPLVGETDANDCQVYLSDITSAIPARGQANITLLNKAITYNSDCDRSSFMFDIVNNESWGYQIIDLVFGVYDQGKLIYVRSDTIWDIGPAETTPFDRSFLDGDWIDKELKININRMEIDNAPE